MYVQTFKTDVIVFISIIMCLPFFSAITKFSYVKTLFNIIINTYGEKWWDNKNPQTVS